MISIFLKLFKKEYDNEKRSNSGFKPKAWVQFQADIQNIYLDDEHIIIAKL